MSPTGIIVRNQRHSPIAKGTLAESEGDNVLRRLRWRTESMFVFFLCVVAVVLAIAFLNTIGARGIAGTMTSGLVIFFLVYCAAGSMKHRRRR
jgi:hypothetical protein